MTLPSFAEGKIWEGSREVHSKIKRGGDKEMGCRDAIDAEKIYGKFCGKCIRWNREAAKGLCRLTNEGTGFFHKCGDFSEDFLKCSVFDKDCLYYLVTNYCGKTGLYLGIDLTEGLMVDTDALKKICSLPT